MKFDTVPNADDPKKNHTPGSKGNSFGSKQPSGKKENLWKGRFDRRKAPREAPIDFPMPNAEESTKKPADD